MSTRTFYNKINENYHSKNKVQKRIIDSSNFTYRNLIPILDKYIVHKKKVLDIGCGAGTIDFYLESKGVEVLGIDASQNALKIAEESSIVTGTYKNIKFRKIVFPDKAPRGKFDVVILTEAIEHFINDNLAVKKIYKLLSRGGIIILSTPSKNAPLYKIGLLKNFDNAVGHLRRYNLNEVVSLLKSSGFEIILVKKTEGLIRNFLFTNKYASKLIKFLKFQISDLVAFVDQLTIPFLGESQIIIVARKPDI